MYFYLVLLGLFRPCLNLNNLFIFLESPHTSVTYFLQNFLIEHTKGVKNIEKSVLCFFIFIQIRFLVDVFLYWTLATLR